MAERLYNRIAGTSLAILVIAWHACRVQGEEPAPEASGIQSLARGPIHEAFAEPIVYDAKPGPVIRKQPPQTIHELPLAIKPAGSRVDWLPGYWAWDEARADFLWVSGGWRIAPPGARWTPGYWRAADGGYQWIPGFWADAAAAQIRYLPDPPPSRESTPTSPQPTPDHFYVPGHWARSGNDYVWKAGYWAKSKPGWNWIPAHYVRSPAGSIFVAGRWDYPLTQRGLLAAPVVVDASLAAQRGFRLTLRAAVNLSTLTNHFFVHPASDHDYFGDYSAAGDAEAGFQPWYAFQDSGKGYLPEYVYSRWLFSRANADWDAEMRAAYQAGGAGQGAGLAGATDARLVLSLDQALQANAVSLPLAPISDDARVRAQTMKEHLQALANHRSKAESNGAETLRVGPAADRPAALDLPHLPAALSGVFGAGAKLDEGVGASLPGIAGRVVPGTAGRAVPGLSGRVIPGTEQIGPGVGNPSSKNGKLPGQGRAPSKN